jgi:hypothetical protein
MLGLPCQYTIDRRLPAISIPPDNPANGVTWMLDTTLNDGDIPEQYRQEAFTVKELCIKWRCVPSTIYSLHNSGKLTLVKIGRKTVAFREELERFKRANELPRNAAPAKAEGGA